MGLFFAYILKSAICLALFYLFYRLLLSKETFHRFNRIALLGILPLSLLIPLIEVTTTQHTEMAKTMLTLEQLLIMANFYQDTVSVTTPVEANSNTLSGIQIGLIIYLAGILFFACRNLCSLTRLLLLLRSGKKEKYHSGIQVITHNKEIAPFSWMKYIVISRTDLEENGREILIHETAHIHNRHSIDLLIADVCIFFQWFNPAAWLLKQELQNIHEYEADETVIKEGVDAKQYQLLLIKKAVGTRLYSMANSFNHSTLKKRITMMLKEKSNPWARLKYLYVLPLAAITVTAFARPEISEKAAEISAVKVNDLTAIVETKVVENILSAESSVVNPTVIPVPLTVKDTVKTKQKEAVIVTISSKEDALSDMEEMPEFPGGTEALKEYLDKNMKYPAEAKEKGTQGRVIVQFVVDEKGKVTSPKIARSVDPSLDAEALRLIENMPQWTPGKKTDEKGKSKAVATQYTLPIAFRMKKSTSFSIKESFPIEKTDYPLIIVDGKEISNNMMNAINPDWIESISVLKDASATAIYGARGANGVILINLKTKEEYAAQKEKPAKTLGERLDALYQENNVKAKDVSYFLNDKPVSATEIQALRPEKGNTYGIKVMNVSGKTEVRIITRSNDTGIRIRGVRGEVQSVNMPSDGKIRIAGKVQDTSGSPVVGASVLIEGTTTGTVADRDGTFVLDAPKNSTLSISYIDMKTAKVKVENTTPLIVTLKAD